MAQSMDDRIHLPPHWVCRNSNWNSFHNVILDWVNGWAVMAVVLNLFSLCDKRPDDFHVLRSRSAVDFVALLLTVSFEDMSGFVEWHCHALWFTAIAEILTNWVTFEAPNPTAKNNHGEKNNAKSQKFHCPKHKFVSHPSLAGVVFWPPRISLA
jgi:hypothetical protein